MPITRRDFLKAGATVAAAATAPRPLLVYLGRRPEPVPPIQDPRLKELALRALEAARGAGAAYADVRLTHDWDTGGGGAVQNESLAVGVRALVNGYWGFASGPVWSPDEMARLGREAVHQAQTNALGKSRIVELAPAPTVRDGHWVMPVKIDPFEISPSEVQDLLVGLSIYTERFPGTSVQYLEARFRKQEEALASTEGTYCTQRLYGSTGAFWFNLVKGDKGLGRALDGLTPAGLGFERFSDGPLREAIRRLIADMEEDLTLPEKPVDIGRYDTVFDAGCTARLLAATLGPATQLDRALGYEANAGGTSYITAPFDMLGSYQMGAPSLTVTANRSEPGGCATVQWDDDGVVPDEFTLVKDGVLVDFQTTRESAGWLKGYYAAHGHPFRSHGCAAAASAISAPLQRTPNLVVAPGPEATDFDDLIAGLTTGIAVKDVDLNVDFQHLNGSGRLYYEGARMGSTYEVKRGKRVARIVGAGILFRAPEFWKALLRLGGPASARRHGFVDVKGEPAQNSCHSLTAPPALFKQVTVIDPLRRA